MSSLPTWLTPSEFAAEAGVTRRTVYEWKNRGVIAYRTIGPGRVRPKLQINRNQLQKVRQDHAALR